jgi:hypothetical protein
MIARSMTPGIAQGHQKMVHPGFLWVIFVSTITYK